LELIFNDFQGDLLQTAMGLGLWMLPVLLGKNKDN
jgi:hypothetical protein